MGRNFSTRPATLAGRKLCEAVAMHGAGELARQLGIERSRLSRLISGRRTADVHEANRISAAGIALPGDWEMPA